MAGVKNKGEVLKAPAIRSDGPPRAVLTLEPAWFNALQGDNVTLTCDGFQTPGQDSIEWLHNGSAIPIHQDSYIIPTVFEEDSGEYQCRTEHTALSNSVQLQVSRDWLLLQAERLEFLKGDTMTLRCHSWRSQPLHKVTYYHNNKALKYDFQSFNYIVSQVNHTHSGSYSCSGVMGHISHVSATVVITVKDPIPSTSLSSKIWYYIPFYLVMGILFAVDTGLYFTLKGEVNGPKKNTRLPLTSWHKEPEDD
ncbi:low affinity immunoglobulin gamma Fc region receptor III-like [Trichosurus vulpecula]|uniref:low affinity immunoglobulin gamma Fc region receptor III-like n=1 Tax=Trichosurus vulpecula TaxID=9337 RepID=UPI00186B3EE1|nr:low affinity immunoglobulin gamma Fc region receptor III-like [Trichosurus vulpecula]